MTRAARWAFLFLLLAPLAAQIAVKYDLWDETFRFTLNLDGRLLRNETHCTLDAVMAGVRDLTHERP